MARSVDEAFKELVGRLTPSSAEALSASRHRDSIKAKLESKFGMTSFPPTGSFGHGTSVRFRSDIDRFAVIPARNLWKSSNYTLQQVRKALLERFPNTEITVRSPAVVVPFGTGAAENHEIVPCYKNGSKNGFQVYAIPDRSNGYMNASPHAHNAWINSINKKLSGKAKTVMRLVKAWNYYNGEPIRSFYIELRVGQYLSDKSSVYEKYDVRGALKALSVKSLAFMQDPQGISGLVSPCSSATKSTALSKVNTALGRACKALEAEDKGQIDTAFYYWNLLFNNKFPGRW